MKSRDSPSSDFVVEKNGITSNFYFGSAFKRAHLDFSSTAFFGLEPAFGGLACESLLPRRAEKDQS